ncbi:DUF6350 family protein [Microbacterium sp. ZXX196]|uniref:cell division protein PerM n=1 Tax=Microbacterium sp. ZXX196 TaxID=2609291 RepID=UPI0012B926D4|nr:DUF6350 family protein [Microbacterium sp. ZXX196]MTE24513.1 hypothetical protein [Microbacterium sp. ZXX196]
MHRLTIALLAVVDALVCAAAALGAILAPLVLVWLAVFGGEGAWSALWPTTARVWQLGHLVPVSIALDDAGAAAVGIDADGAAFWVSVAPLAFALFSLLFAARSGRRAVDAGAPWSGFAAGTAAFAVAAVVAWASGTAPVAAVTPWQAIVLPAAVYAAGFLLGAVPRAWDAGDGGPLDRLHDALDASGPAWREVPALVLRGAGIVAMGLVAIAGVVLAALFAVRGGEVIALFERARVDAVGAGALTLVHLAYLPTAMVWVVAYLAGPGFAVGTATAVSPAGVSLGVVPGIPILGLLPEGGSAWQLIAVAIPVGLAAAAGGVCRRAFAREWAFDGAGAEPVLPRLAIAGGIAAVVGALGALAAACASGAFGPGRMAEVGPDPGPVALALGLEALVGASILLLAPAGRLTAGRAAPADADGVDTEPDPA